jgi:Tfp pilus assembly protein PilX
MSQPPELSGQKGAILIVSLIITLVITTMGMGLFYIGNRSVDQIAAHTDRSETLYSAEACVDEAVRWLDAESEGGVPCIDIEPAGDVCHRIPPALGAPNPNMNDNWRAGESSAVRASKFQGRMAKHEYFCSITLTATLAALGPKYIYQIESSGVGPKQARTNLVVIASITAGGSSDGGSDVGQANEY